MIVPHIRPTEIAAMARSATVLVVEDEEDVRDVAIGYVSALGYSVLAAGSGDEALKILQSAVPIDLLLTDIVMPGKLDGISLGRHAMVLRPNLKVLHVTGYAHHLADQQGLENGAVIGKPYRKDQLQIRLARLLGSWAVDRNVTLRRLHRYWLGKREGRRWPPRRAIDPADLKEILPNLAIIEVVAGVEQLRFRYRLAGTALVQAYGLNPTGRFVDEITADEYRPFMVGLLQEVATTGTAIYSASAFRLQDTGLSAERLFLPLSVEDDAVSQIVVGQTLDWSARKTIALTVAEQVPGRVDTVERLR
jgi:CheY-like chemotaxis protein